VDTTKGGADTTQFFANNGASLGVWVVWILLAIILGAIVFILLKGLAKKLSGQK